MLRSKMRPRASWLVPALVSCFGGTAALGLGEAAAATPPPASAPAAKTLYDKGATEYNLGHFPEAIANFEKAYELDPAPILLFNIAQSHRQTGNNERALFFYRRYLEQASPDAANRADVEKRVKDLEEMLAQQSEIKRKPPTEVEDQEHRLPPPAPPAFTTPAPVSSGTTRAVPSQREPVAVARAVPPEGSPVEPFRVGVEAGVAFSQFHGRDLEQPGQLALRAFAGYLVTLAPFPLEVGAALSMSPLPYKAEGSGGTSSDQTATLIGLWARAAAVIPVAPQVDVVGELGAGVVWWSGIEEGNPFTQDGAGATGAIPMPSFRLSAGVRYRLPAPVFLYAQPAFTWCKTTSGLSDSVSSITRFELPLGVGLVF